MTQVPDYSGLEAEWQADCQNWNSAITAENHRQPALSNPSSFLRLFNNRYDIYNDLKAELDLATRAAGWLTVLYSSGVNRRMLACSRGALGHGMGNLLHLIEACHETLEDTARQLLAEESQQKTTSLQKYNGKKWLGRLPHQVARAALDILARTRGQAMAMLKNKIPRRCTASNCTCPVYTQYGLICASRMADKEEVKIPLDKADVHEFYWLDRDLSGGSPLLTVLSPKKVTKSRGRPRETSMFGAGESGILGDHARAVMGKKTSSTTTSLGKKAGDKTRLTTASVQRVNSNFEWNDSTLQSLDEEDSRSSSVRQEAVRRDQRLAAGLTRARKRGSAAIASSAPPAIASSSRPAPKRRRVGLRNTVNQLPYIDLTAGEVDGEADEGDVSRMETQGTIVCRTPSPNNFVGLP